MKNSDLINIGKRSVEMEQGAVQEMLSRIDENFALACRTLLACKGRIVVIGIGKSGHIARKIASTFASTGSPSFFVHSAEAGHGDMGMITEKDVAIMISYSGKSEELVRLLPIVKRMGIKMIAMTGSATSPLAKAADIHISVKISKEACPLNLAPTSSTTATLVMGDAMAIAMLEARGFTADDFAFSHPSGALGRKLLLRVSDVMHSGKDIPMVNRTVKIAKALHEMTSKRLGMTTIVDEQKQLVGIFTDGDLRRCLDKRLDVHQKSVGEVMTTKFQTVRGTALAAEALKLMDSNKINALPVVDEDNKLIGAMNMHDLLKSGVL